MLKKICLYILAGILGSVVFYPLSADEPTKSSIEEKSVTIKRPTKPFYYYDIDDLNYIIVRYEDNDDYEIFVFDNSEDIVADEMYAHESSSSS